MLLLAVKATLHCKLFQLFEIFRAIMRYFLVIDSERMFRKFHVAENTNFNLYARLFPDQQVEDAKEFKNKLL